MLTILVSFASAAFYFQHEEKSFVHWMREQGRVYTSNEYHLRFGIWLGNMRYVQEHNAVKAFSVSMNSLAALTPAEYQSMLGYKIDLKHRTSASSADTFVSNDEVDWRKKGVVTDIKDQGQCGSCWAFSAVQGVESADAIKTGKLLSYSESNLVDCVAHCRGCNGGSMYIALLWVLDKQGGKMMLESDYPYHPVQGSCRFDASKGVGSLSDIRPVKTDSEEDLAQKCAQYGPVSVAIDASHTSFQLYKGGIYDEPECSSKVLDHGVGCVGYGSENGQGFWFVKNSWGVKWGENGYIRMIRKNNQCGIASVADVPVA
jgi:C1A family cysteine protease